MIDPTSVASGIVTHYTTKTIDESLPPKIDAVPFTDTSNILTLLTEIRDALSPRETHNKDFVFALQPYPYEYPIDDRWLDYPHLCIFFSVATPLRFDIEGVGTYLKTVGPGWVQCDVRGRISTTDSLNHNIIVSYREDALGISL